MRLESLLSQFVYETFNMKNSKEKRCKEKKVTWQYTLCLDVSIAKDF